MPKQVIYYTTAPVGVQSVFKNQNLQGTVELYSMPITEN